MRTASSLALAAMLAIGSAALWSVVSVRPAAGADAAAAETDATELERSETGDIATPAFPLEGTRWRLTDYLKGSKTHSSGGEVATWITLTAGNLRGSGGCNRLAGSYATVGERIAFAPRLQGERACAEQTTIVERGLTDGLQRVDSYRLLPTADAWAATLVLSDAEGVEVLRFGLDDAAALTADEWRLAAYTAEQGWIPADATQPAVLRFDPSRQNALQRSSEGEVVGSSGCNGLVGRFFRHASVLSFGQLAVTDAPCTPAATAQEEVMLAVLNATALRMELLPDRLILASADTAAQLEFVTAAPLEHSTWLLAKLPGAASPAESVTFRLADGRLEGEGPCGPYSGSYETNGQLLSFTGLTGAAVAACADIRAERLLLNALRRTVLVDRSTSSLGLLDPFGKTVARFDRAGRP